MIAELLTIYTKSKMWAKWLTCINQEEVNEVNDETNRVYEADWGLQTSAKRSKLTQSQIMFLWSKAHKEVIPISELSRLYKLAPSILHKIKKLNKIVQLSSQEKI